MKTIPDDTNVIDAAEQDYLYTGESQIPNSGSGLFTVIDIYKDEIVAVFKGEILTDKQVEKRVKAGKDKYFIKMLNGSIMDSMHVPCFAKYANDAIAMNVTGYRNNTRITIDEQDNICMEATKNIKAGEEVFCSYGKRYWNKHG